jgi:hypothetical protein
VNGTHVENSSLRYGVTVKDKEPRTEESRTTLIVDCTRAGEIQNDGEVTQHPIEDGSQIADHVIIKPRRFQMSGMISNHPIVEGAGGSTSVTLVGAVGFALNQFVVEGEEGDDYSDENRAKTAYDMLNEMMHGKNIVQVSSDLDIFENMVCVGATFPRNGRTANVLEFSLTFTEVSFARSDYQMTDFPQKVAPAVKQSVKKMDNGKKPAEKKTEQSIAAKADDALDKSISRAPK